MSRIILLCFFAVRHCCIKLLITVITINIFHRQIFFLVELSTAQPNYCPNGQSYFPCSCSLDDLGYQVFCDEVSLSIVADVFAGKPATDLFDFHVILSFSDWNGTIPANLIDQHRASRIRISGYRRASYSFQITVNPNAFRLSSNFTKALSIYYLDVSGFDFQFLQGFEKLSFLELSWTKNVQLADWISFPGASLTSLDTLIIDDSTGLNEWKTFPQLPYGLNKFQLNQNEIYDSAMGDILDWVAQYSANTLTDLHLNGNNLTTIPSQISLFKKLELLYTSQQSTKMTKIYSGAWTFASPVYFISAWSSGIEEIQDGAFNGLLHKTFCELIIVYRKTCKQIYSNQEILALLLLISAEICLCGSKRESSKSRYNRWWAEQPWTSDIVNNFRYIYIY